LKHKTEICSSNSKLGLCGDSAGGTLSSILAHDFKEKIDLETKNKKLIEKISLLENENAKKDNEFTTLQKKYSESINDMGKLNKEMAVLKQESKQIAEDKNGALNSLRQLRQEYNFLKRTSEIAKTNLTNENCLLRNQIKDKTEFMNNFVTASAPQQKSLKRSVENYRNDLSSLDCKKPAKLRKIEHNDRNENDHEKSTNATKFGNKCET